jgi:hypothetical protein
MKLNKLTPHTNPTLWNELTRHGAPRPSGSSCTWNDWAANNPTPQALALANLDIVKPMMGAMKAIATGARPVNH